MTSVFSLLEVLWRPEEVVRRRVSWLIPYVSSVILIGALGLYTRQRLTDLMLTQLSHMGVTAEGMALFERGSYIGISVVAFFLPLLIPWCAAFISKLVALFLGSRTTFGELFAVYQWGYYVSSLAGVLLKGTLFLILPVEAWSKVTLSLAAFVPETAPSLMGIAGAFDLTLLVLFGVAFVGLQGSKGKQEWAIPVWTLVAFLVVQVTVGK